jgi:hypothetical protein
MLAIIFILFVAYVAYVLWTSDQQTLVPPSSHDSFWDSPDEPPVAEQLHNPAFDDVNSASAFTAGLAWFALSAAATGVVVAIVAFIDFELTRF